MSCPWENDGIKTIKPGREGGAGEGGGLSEVCVLGVGVGRSVHENIKWNGSLLSDFLCSKVLIISRFNSTNWLQQYFKKHVNGLFFD